MYTSVYRFAITNIDVLVAVNREGGMSGNGNSSLTIQRILIEI